MVLAPPGGAEIIAAKPFIKMFGFLKNLWGGKSSASANPAGGASEFAQATASQTCRGEASEAAFHRNGNGGAGNHNGQDYLPSGGFSRGSTGRGVELPLQPILDSLPLELQARVCQPNAGSLTIHVPLERVLAQLAQGAVKIPFAELRACAPQVFQPGPELDKTLVTLPLATILTRINPALIRRRRVQKSVHVPDEISSPFDARSRSLSPAGVEPARPTGATPISGPAPLDMGRPPLPLQAPDPSVRPGLAPLQSHPAPGPIPMPSRPVLPASRPISPIQPDTSFKERQPALPANKPENPSPVGGATTSPIPFTAGSSTAGVPSGAALTIPLAPLTEGWPEAIRKEIVQLGLVETKAALPIELVDRALRQGRVTFTWRMLRAWLRPSPPPSVSVNDGTVLELPLKVVAPLYLAKQRETAKAHPKVSVDENIPNLFFGFPQPDSAPGGAAGTAKPSDTNYYVWDEKRETARPADAGETPNPSAGTRFVTKYAAPNEIVSRAAALDGVAGALIALPDGLLVASQIPGDFNPDTLAAFLPQIFSKVSQCTKELRMGDLNNLNFTVGNVPWKIFRVNAIYFAAFGRAGEAMPTANLAALAAELDHKPR